MQPVVNRLTEVCCSRHHELHLYNSRIHLSLSLCLSPSLCLCLSLSVSSALAVSKRPLVAVPGNSRRS